MLFNTFLPNNQSNSKETYSLTNANQILKDEHFNVELPTVLYAHGWTESVNSKSVQHIVNAYFTRGGWNIIALDWQHLAGNPLYTAATENVKLV